MAEHPDVIAGAEAEPFDPYQLPTLSAAFDAQDWKLRAACSDEDPNLFYPPPGERPETRRLREGVARQVCAGCPVKRPCRDYARRNREYGVWGGESEEDRALRGYAPDMPVGNVDRARRHAKAGTVVI